MTQFSISFFISALVSLFFSEQLSVNSEQLAANSYLLADSCEQVSVNIEPSTMFTDNCLLLTDTPPPDSTENPNDRIGDATTQPTISPMWLQNPSNMVTTYELAPDGKGYYIYEKIGGINVRPPSYISFEDYIKMRQDKMVLEGMREAALANNKETKKGLIPNIEIAKIDDVFGGGAISIQPTGNVALNFSLDRNVIKNPSLPLRQQKNQYFTFDPQIQVGVLGQIGDKLKLNISQDTKASFDFENISNLNFKGNEDQIVQSVDVGAVTLPLGNTLIQGSSNIFGVKAGLKFGPVTMSVITGVDRGQRQTMSVQGGVVETTYKKMASEYDQNRHFFLSHYFRSKYDESLSRLPQIVSRYRINQLEVWVSNPNLSQTSNLRPGIGFVDLGENDLPVANGHGVIFNKSKVASAPAPALRYPGNEANDLYTRLKNEPNLRDKSLAPTILENQFQMTNAVDFQLVNLRKLQEGKDYNFNPQLGFLSMSSQLQSDEILFVAFSYTLDDKPYQVGEFSNDVAADTLNTKPLFLKMIRPAQLRPTYNNAAYPPWDLMMKNFYSIGYGLKPDGFKMQVMYESGTKAGKLNFLPAPKDTTAKNIPLLQLLDLDQLTNNTAPDPDNLFDYIEGLTVNTERGYIMIPHLEPFGTHLAKRMHNNADDSTRYCFQPLYDMTYQDAIQKFTQLNRYSLEGSYQGGGNSSNNSNNPNGMQQSSAEIPLNGFNIQPNQVTITANGIKLQQGVDYEVDPSGTKAIIKNPAYIGKGQDLQVSIDQNSTFQMQTKTLIGTRLEYSPIKNTKVGFTALRLNERPMNIKTTIGDEPVRNSVLGLDLASQRELPFLTKALDKLPLLSTKAPSNMNFSGEIAQFIPGQPKQVLQDSLKGVTYLDDFEAAKLPFNMMGVQRWKLASFPKYQHTSDLFDPKIVYTSTDDSLAANYSRAKLSWYQIDPQVYNRQYAEIPTEDRYNSYTRMITQNEIFPTITALSGSSYQPTFDLRYQPSKRGPYNYQTDPNRINVNGELSVPYESWAGIMADINTNTDFEAQNVEFIEFWLLDPFLDDSLGVMEGGEFVLNLGNISEDVIPDNLQFFENGLPETGGNGGVANTVWGRVPTSIPPSNAFGNNADARKNQDVGLEGLSTDQERTFFQKYLDKLAATYSTTSDAYINFLKDPSSDDYTHYLNGAYNAQKEGILNRFENTYGTEANSPVGQTNNGIILQGSQYPDTEDLNRNGTPNMWEEYWEYKIKLDRANLVPGKNYVVDRVASPRVPLNPSGTITDNVIWYQFRIPINSGKAINNIPNFKVINFMRLYMTHFNQATILRMADFQMVSTQWRKYDGPMTDVTPSPNPTEPPFGCFEVGSVSVQENSQKQPFNYVKPPGVFQQGLAGNTQQGFLQDERSLLMEICDLAEGDARGVFKNVTQDLRNYKNLRMFVHSEPKTDATANANFDQPGDAVAFIRLGLDNDLNYYEYEIPLTPSNPNGISSDPYNVWRDQFFFELELLTTAKDDRNKAGFGILDRYLYQTGLPAGHKIYVKGTPKLSDIRSIMIGVRNPKLPNEGPVSIEVWLDELSLTSFNQSSAWAANANLNITLADFGTIQASLQERKAGFGTLDQRISQRTREDMFKYSAMGDFQLHKFTPQKWGINLPLHINQDEQFGNPVYDPREADVLTKNIYKGLTKPEVKEIKSVIQTYQRNRGIAFNNIKKNKTGTGTKSHIWDIENIDASFAYSDQLGRNYMSEKMFTNNYRGSLNYRYTIAKPLNIQPFKKWKHKNPISEFNFSPLPKSVTVSLIGDRQFSENRYRATAFGGITTPVYTKNFVLTRNYQLAWDLTKSLSLNFNAANNARIDEVKGYWNETDQNYRDSVGHWTDNFLHVGQDTINTKYVMQNGQPYQRVYNRKITMGRTIGYNHNVNVAYTLPFNKFKMTDWITGNVTYAGTFQWLNPPEVNKGLGSTIINGQNIQSQGRLDFDALYGKNKALKKYLDPAPYKAPPAPPKDKDGKPIKSDKPKEKPAITINPDWKDAHKLNPPKQLKLLKALVRGFVRLLFSVKNADVNYNQTAGTTLPGYLGVNDNLGADFSFVDTTNMMNNRKSPIAPPTWGFLAGSQQDIRTIAGRYGWISKDTTLSNYWAKNITTQLTAKAALQPLPGFKIDVTATRNMTENESEMFRWDNQANEYGHTDQQFSGNYSVSYIFINTAFGSNRANAFRDFGNARKDLSQRFYQENTSRVVLPTNPNTPNDILADGYRNGYSRTSQEVLLPAFLAGYGVVKADKIGLSPFPNIPLPNWSVNFTPMTAFPQMKQTFSAFTIKHNYRGTYTVGGYTRNLNAVDIDKDGYADNFSDAGTDIDGNAMVNFNPIKNIPLAQIQEQMSPLIGVNTTLKNGMNINLSYGKTRTMTFNVGNLQMTEDKSDDFSFTFGYRKDKLNWDLHIFNKDISLKNSANVNCTVSIKDNEQRNYTLDGGQSIALRGNLVATINPSVDYVISNKLQIKAFWQQNITRPHTSLSYPNSFRSAGVQIRFMLN